MGNSVTDGGVSDSVVCPDIRRDVGDYMKKNKPNKYQTPGLFYRYFPSVLLTLIALTLALIIWEGMK